MKKILNFILVACLMLSGMMVLTACDKTQTFHVDAENIASSVEKAADGDVIKLKEDIVLTSQVVINKKLTIDLNGKTISSEQAIWNNDTKSWSLLSIGVGGDVTITGNGTMQALAEDCYAIDLRAADAKLTIENGTFVGNVHSVYVYQGSLTVKGGYYSIQQTYPALEKAYEFVLNCLDLSYGDEVTDSATLQYWATKLGCTVEEVNSYANTASIIVMGGTFEAFNPEHCFAETSAPYITNFCADGYVSVLGNSAPSGLVTYTVEEAGIQAE